MAKNKDENKSLKVKTGLKSKTINVDYLARVEGEGALSIVIKSGKVSDVQLKIFEPPRFFEAFMQNRDYREAPDITARICGICPVAYQMSAVTAIENALSVEIPDEINRLRRLLYCGEWIESHTLHVIMLHAPDFMGYQDAISMAKDHPERVKCGLAIKKAGNEIVRLLGGREIHPINVQVGGFYKLPEIDALEKLKETLKVARDQAYEIVQWVSGFDFPDFEQDYEFVALSHASEYPMHQGRIVSSQGLDIAVSDYDQHFEEFQVKHSHALHSRLKERDNYFAGPLARYNLNADKLPKLIQQAITSIGFERYCKNPFKSIIVRALEVLFSFDEAIRIIDGYEPPALPAVKAEPRAAKGYGATEAPRGLLYHRYQIDEQGLMQDIKIVPPTSQNQYTIECDLRHFVKQSLNLPERELTWQCEQAIRNYDPCISCSTHFLKVNFIHD